MNYPDLSAPDRLIASIRKARQERIERHGFSPDCQCDYCGDTGMNPAEGSICLCAVGDAKRQQIDLAARWPTLIPTRFESYRLGSCPNQQLADQVAHWLANDPLSDGRNLVIAGPVGVGKTGAAIGALHTLHFAGYSIGYWSLPNLMDIFRQEERGLKHDRDYLGNRSVPVMETISKIDCLLLDDLGQERATAYVAERLHVLIDGRYTASRPTIITTNLSGAALAGHIGERAASRIRECYTSVQAIGPDLRANLQVVRSA